MPCTFKLQQTANSSLSVPSENFKLNYEESLQSFVMIFFFSFHWDIVGELTQRGFSCKISNLRLSADNSMMLDVNIKK